MHDPFTTDCCRGLIKCTIRSHVCGVCRGSYRKFKAEAALIDYNAAVPEPYRIYLNVPFADKNAAKKLGARWNNDRKMWYCDARRDHEHVALFSKWMKKAAPEAVVIREPAKPTIVPTPVISFDELSEALAFANTVNGAVATPVTEEKEMAYVSRTISRNASYR